MEFKVPATGAEWRSAPRVCRCCLSEGCYKDISTEYYWMGEKETYADMLKECFDLTISFQDAANSNGRLICEVCITRLRDATNFKKQVVRSEQRFAEHLQSGASLSTISVTESPYQEVKVEGVKDELLVSDDDEDDDAPMDDDTLDPDYDESDSLPLKYEVQKKEALVELSFGDEIPTLSNTETTIRRVSAKGKDKSPAKKLKLNKKELTIKPVKASGSKVKPAKAPKAPKAPKVPKPAKPAAKKGPPSELDRKGVPNEQTKILVPVHKNVIVVKPNDKISFKKRLRNTEPARRNATIILERSTAAPQRFAKISREAATARRIATVISDCTRAASQRFAKISQNPLTVRRNATVILECSTAVPFRYRYGFIVCAFCDDMFTDPSRLREHTVSQHSNHNVISAFIGLTKEQPVKVDLRDLACKLCSHKLQDLKCLTAHLADVHGKDIDRSVDEGVVPFALDKNSWRCYLCEDEFSTMRDLNIHMDVHLQKYMCEACGKGFFLEGDLNKHVKAVCNQSGTRKPKPHRCTKCGQCFTFHHMKLNHMVAAHGCEPKLYKCAECPSTFRSTMRRYEHLKIHHKHYNHKCPRCPKTFIKVRSLEAHVERHSAVKPSNGCQTCGKMYATRKLLMQHVRFKHKKETGETGTSINACDQIT